MNAIILAAGVGSRLLPLTQHAPKPLTQVAGGTIIERQIAFLKEIGINRIHVVVGHLFESFSYLRVKHGVEIVYNPHFALYNNFYSLFHARSFFGDSYVIEGDVFLHRNFLLPALTHSTYFTGLKKDWQNEWILQFNNNIIESILLPGDAAAPLIDDLGSGHFVMSGVSYWNERDARFIVEKLEQIVAKLKRRENPALNNLFWDNIVASNIHCLDVRTQVIEGTDWSEVDTPSDLMILQQTLNNVNKIQ